MKHVQQHRWLWQHYFKLQQSHPPFFSSYSVTILAEMHITVEINSNYTQRWTHVWSLTCFICCYLSSNYSPTYCKRCHSKYWWQYWLRLSLFSKWTANSIHVINLCSHDHVKTSIKLSSCYCCHNTFTERPSRRLQVFYDDVVRTKGKVQL